mgnify:CR=1 FL=1
MLCSQCGNQVEESQITMIRGSSVCPVCAEKSRTIGSVGIAIWFVMLLVFVAFAVFIFSSAS